MRFLIVTETDTQPEWLIGRVGPLVERTRAHVDLGVVSLGKDGPEQRHRTYLDQLSKSSGRTNPSMAPSVLGLPARPRDKLTRLSRSYDLIVLAPLDEPTRAPLQRSLTIRMMQHTRCALWVPHPPVVNLEEGEARAAPPPRCLVGVNVQGPRRRDVLRMAADWSYLLGCPLDAFYATPDAPSPDDTSPSAQQQLERLMQETVLPEVRGASHIRTGKPDAIVAEMSKDYAFVIVGNRDQEGLRGFVEGPLSSQFDNKAQCEVLTLPTRQLD